MLLGAALVVRAGESAWAFEPGLDDFRPDALLDLRSLNEPMAGESGFVRVDPNGDFVLGNGQPYRFWPINTGCLSEQPFTPKPLGRKTAPDLDRHARWLAKRGVNMVRLHLSLNPDLKSQPEAKLTDVNKANLDYAWRAVAAMKKQGIYVTFSPYWANTMQFKPEWGFGTEDAHGLLFFDKRLQDAYKAWWRTALTTKNPYTGIPLAQEPSIAILQLQNEDSLLFWTVNNLKGSPRRDLGRQFGDWLKRKYGSLDKAYAAWGNAKMDTDDVAAGVLDFRNIYEMTLPPAGQWANRLADQLQFWSATMFDFNKSMSEFLRKELGCRQLINAGNWRTASTLRLNDAERWSYTANDVLAVNRYYTGLHNGPNRGWAIQNGDEFTNPSILRDPLEFPLNVKQVRGRPMLVSESSWVMPMAYASEGPFLVAAYSSLTGLDSFYWFATGDDEWSPPQSANGYNPSQQKWLCAYPDCLAQFPAAALLFRKGYVQHGPPAVVEERALADLWQRTTPIIAEESGYDPNRDSGDIAARSSVKTTINPLAFLVGPVEVVYGGDQARSKVAELSRYIDAANGTIHSLTGELTLNTRKNFCTLDAPKAQGVTGFFEQQKQFELRDVTIRTGNHYGAVLVVALDNKPLKESGKVLIQVGTQCRPTGWQEEPAAIKTQEGKTIDGFRVVNYGQAPWQVIQADVAVTIRNTGLKKATALDMNGNATGNVALDRNTGNVSLKFPAATMYLILE